MTRRESRAFRTLVVESLTERRNLNTLALVPSETSPIISRQRAIKRARRPSWKRERGVPTPRRGARAAGQRAILARWSRFERGAMSSPSGNPAAMASSGNSDGSFLHLSQWKPSRTTTWQIPRLTYGEPPILCCGTAHPSHSSPNPDLQSRPTVSFCASPSVAATPF